ncbi:hypothetical protein BGY98DRAFT_218368 [Russula aff. rugulosa BPL654]|nr:hypothetical protein BGY98DRAFT_218368 [Russula aff. rugulosa BPL654]
MRRHKTVALVILILSIVKFVLAAPALRRIHEAREDAIVRVLEDVGAVANKRDDGIGNDRSSTFESGESSDRSPTMGKSLDHPSTLGESLDHPPTLGESLGHPPTLGESLDHSPTLGESSDHSPTLGESLDHPPTLGESLDRSPTLGESSDHSSTSESGESLDRSPTLSDSYDRSSISTVPPKPPPLRKRPKIMTPEKIRSLKIFAPIGLFTVAILGLVDINVSLQNDTSSSPTSR